MDFEFYISFGNYSQIDSSLNVSFYFGWYSDTEFTIYLNFEINSDTNKKLLINIVIESDLYVSVCNIFPIQALDRWFEVLWFAQRIWNVSIVTYPFIFNCVLE